ncbi:UNVERIFIED_CONTAM: hypothetical protein Sindi_2878000 [Sesamum indicum]
MSLVSAPLDGNNFLTWSRAIKLALGAKQKIGFVDGSYTKPQENKEEMDQWKTVDCMVASWLLNSISKEISEAFMYTSSAQDLWEQLEARFGDSNGPMLYDIQRRISSLSQGDMTISAYFTKLKKLWDELAHLDPLPNCSCDASKLLASQESSRQLIQFFMGLEDTYDHIRSQILLMEPLPTIGKAYSMLLRIEKQRQVHIAAPEDGAMNARISEGRRQFANQNREKGKGGLDKKSQYCDYCKRSGHTRSSCFKWTGFPEWYKTLLDQKKIEKGSSNRVFNASAEERLQKYDSNLEISDLIKMEVKRAMNEQRYMPEPAANMIEYQDFTGNTLALFNTTASSINQWIIDSGASTHMCCELRLLSDPKALNSPIHVKLPDGTVKKVNWTGKIQLTKEIILNEVLYVPTFKHNLLSVSKACYDNSLRITFTNNKCLLQDHVTMKILAVGNLVGRLYMLNRGTCSHITELNETKQIHDLHCMKALASDVDLWHKRLGHTSVDVLKHTVLFKNSNVTLNICDVCPLAKQHRLPFHSSYSNTLKTFEYVTRRCMGTL